MASITYTWEITGVKTKDLGNNQSIIVQSYWKKIGTDSFGNVGTFNGATPFDATLIDPNNFVPYASLTEQTILGWIQSIVVGDYDNHINEHIANQIEHSVNPVTEQSLPWINTTSANTSADTTVDTPAVANTSTNTSTKRK